MITHETIIFIHIYMSTHKHIKHIHRHIYKYYTDILTRVPILFPNEQHNSMNNKPRESPTQEEKRPLKQGLILPRKVSRHFENGREGRGGGGGEDRTHALLKTAL